MSNHDRDRALALAGVFQAARLAQQLARQGQTDKGAFSASINSILAIDAGSTEEVYGSAEGVALGLQLLHDKLTGGSGPAALELARYVIAMIQLERTLEKRPEIQETIRQGIEAAGSQMKFFQEHPRNGETGSEEETVHPRLIEKLAELYIQTVSTLTPRIMINGEQGYLANPLIAAKVRAALLAGIRSAFLWRQLGGNRWQLLFGRRKIALEAERILKETRSVKTIH